MTLADVFNPNIIKVGLESDDKDECLIVTSIQKMSRINTANNIPQSTIDRINKKRVVFIVDECHLVKIAYRHFLQLQWQLSC